MKQEEDKDKPTTFEDAIIVGILKAKKHKVVPTRDERKRISFAVYGDVEKSLQEIYENVPVGALDALTAIKETRSMIFTLLRGQR